MRSTTHIQNVRYGVRRDDEGESLTIISSTPTLAKAAWILADALRAVMCLHEKDSYAEDAPHISRSCAFPKPLAGALAYAEENFSDSNLTARRVAEISGVSQQRLAKLFRDFVGTTFTHWLACYRISRAKELLRHSNQKILDIALASGFGAISSFNRVFRKQTGITPREYRMRVES